MGTTLHFVLSLFLFAACGGGGARPKADDLPASPAPGFIAKNELPVGEYVVEIFEDRQGHMWFGTMSEGIARYDGKSLTYLTVEDGLAGNAVVAIAEDHNGHLWFGTHAGLSRYDGQNFTTYTRSSGLTNDRVSELLVDQTGALWIGTWGGVFRFDGTRMIPFDVPIPEVSLMSYQSTMDWVTEILEDREGNIWFGRDGYGACRYDGTGFTHFTAKDGLASDNVQAITEDTNGHIWFSSRVKEKDNPDAAGRTGPGGISRYDGHSLKTFPDVAGLSENDSYAIHAAADGNIWIGANGVGAYRYDGQTFTLFKETDRPDLMPYGFGIQDIQADKNGRVWLGLSGGLFRLDSSSLHHISRRGPWL